MLLQGSQYAVNALIVLTLSLSDCLTLCLQQFQELEEQRIAYLRHQMWTYTNLLSKCTVDIDTVSVVWACECSVCGGVLDLKNRRF